MCGQLIIKLYKKADGPASKLILFFGRLMTMEIEGSLKVLLILLKNLEKAMANHSSTLPMDGEPGGLWSVGSQRVRHN